MFLAIVPQRNLAKITQTVQIMPRVKVKSNKHYFKSLWQVIAYFLKILFIYSFIRHTEIGRDTGRGRSGLPARSPKQGLKILDSGIMP